LNNQPTKHKHADLILEFARQKAIGEFDAGWWKWEHSGLHEYWKYTEMPDFSSFQYRYTATDKNPAFKPKPKLIDMSLLPLGCQVGVNDKANVQLMHAFAAGNAWVWNAEGSTVWRDISELRIAENKEFTFYDCKVGKCPVPEGCNLEVIYRDATKGIGSTLQLYWKEARTDTACEIIAYRIISVAEGYTDNPNLVK
jgi:hypothetical protein